MKKTLVLMMAITLMAGFAGADVWNLVDDYSGYSYTSGPWSFYGAYNTPDWGSNIDTTVANYVQLTELDWNVGSDRIMISEDNDNVYSYPYARFLNYLTDSRNFVQGVNSGDALDDSMVAWTSPVDGTIAISGSVLDTDSNNGNGVLRISIYDGTGTDDVELDAITITNNATEADTYYVEADVEVGDIIYVRKTYYKLDSYGCSTSKLTLNIETIPEPATMGIIALGGAAALIRRRRK